MNRRDFERLVARAVDRIPQEFLDRVENLTFVVEEWADPETLDEVGFDDPRDMLGFYHGVALPDRTYDYPVGAPDVIVIYRGAIEDYVAETGEPLMKVIRETVIHELAHYFGFSEEEMDGIEALWAGDEPS
jgi:predicted Zn-dependent protease with MMP-like domain